MAIEQLPSKRWVIMAGSYATARTLNESDNLGWALWRAGLERECGEPDVQIWDVHTTTVWTYDGEHWNPQDWSLEALASESAPILASPSELS